MAPLVALGATGLCAVTCTFVSLIMCALRKEASTSRCSLRYRNFCRLSGRALNAASVGQSSVKGLCTGSPSSGSSSASCPGAQGHKGKPRAHTDHAQAHSTFPRAAGAGAHLQQLAVDGVAKGLGHIRDVLLQREERKQLTPRCPHPGPAMHGRNQTGNNYSS